MSQVKEIQLGLREESDSGVRHPNSATVVGSWIPESVQDPLK